MLLPHIFMVKFCSNYTMMNYLKSLGKKNNMVDRVVRNLNIVNSVQMISIKFKLSIYN